MPRGFFYASENYLIVLVITHDISNLSFSGWARRLLFKFPRPAVIATPALRIAGSYGKSRQLSAEDERKWVFDEADGTEAIYLHFGENSL